MAKAENVVLEPVRDGDVKLLELAGKKVIRAFYNHKMSLTGQGSDEGFDRVNRSMFVIASMHEKF